MMSVVETTAQTLADIAVPPTIRDAVAERASRLTPVAQRVLQGLFDALGWLHLLSPRLISLSLSLSL